MNILVTGGCGFVGSHLVDRLVELEHNVVVIDDLSSESSSEDNMNDGAIYNLSDIRDLVYDPHSKWKPEIVFHLAARARIQPSFLDPVEYFDIDAKGTCNVLEYARKCGAKVVYAGSSSAYGGPMLNPYAFAKYTGEQLLELYNKVYGISTVTARFFNVYGKRQPTSGSYATVVGIFEKLTQESSLLTVTGNGEQRRDFTHVSDIVEGFIALAAGEHNAEVYNLGTGTNYSINELARMFGPGIKYIAARPGEAQNTLADISAMTKATGWTPKVKLEDYVREWKK